ncbi:MAG: acyl-CoA dehydrogenase [Mycobacterium sp.]|nr:acyl-CoA dehydrogenase [Mycobacterium sp.]
MVSAITTGHQSAVRELVRDWAGRVDAPAAVRAVEAGRPSAWRPVYSGLAELGLFDVAVSEDCGGAGGSVADLCAVVEEAARALVPGPVATTALATIVVTDPVLLQAFASGHRTAGVAVDADLSEDSGRVSGSVDYVLGAESDGVLLLPVGERIVLVDARVGGVLVESLTATDFSRPLARVTLDCVPVTPLSFSRPRFRDLAATVLSAEAAGVARWALDTAAQYAKVREQFGKPIGSFQAVKHLCAEMLLRSQQVSAAAADAAVAATDEIQLALAAPVAAAIGIESAKFNTKTCIQVLGGIGITWEHDAHLYLRRAYGISQFLGGRSDWLRRVAVLTVQGVRRELNIDLDSVSQLRPEIVALAAGIADLPVEQRQVALAESGLLAPHWPKPYGRKAGPAEQLLIDQELDRAGVQRPDLVIGWWAVPTILEFGTPDQIDRFVPATLRGEIIWCQLFSEPEAGSDLASLRTKAVRAEGGWRLTGQKVWTSAAQKAHWGICLARTDAEVPKHKGITYFLVDMSSPGIVIRPLREITGDDLFNEVFFDDVFVPDEMVVGTVNDGWRLARTTLANERVAMAHGTALGNPMEEMLRGLSERQLDPAEVDRLGELLLAAQVGSLLDQRIAQLAVGGRDTTAEASARKLIGVRYRQALEEFRMEMSAGAGAVVDEAVHGFLNSRCLSIAGGTEQILLTMAGERLLGLPR